MYYLLLLIIIFLNPGTLDIGEWKLRKEKSGIEVYTRSIANSSFDEFKAITTIRNTTLEEVLDVILDVENYVSLHTECAEARILKQEGKYYCIHYTVLKAPWPVKNRDAVYESVTTFSENRDSVRVELRPLGNYMKEKKGLVRMHEGKGFWALSSAEDGAVQVTYQFHSSPGGNIPSWLVNSVVVSSPYQTLINLKKRLIEP